MRAALNNLEKIIDQENKITPNSVLMYQPSTEKHIDYSSNGEDTIAERTKKIQEELRRTTN